MESLPRRSEAYAGAQVLPSGYKAGLALSVSRQKFDANDILVTVQKFNALQRCGPGLSPFTKLSRVQEQKQNL